MAALLRDALEAMAAALPKPQATNVAPDGFDKWRDAVRIIQAHEIWQVYGRFVEEKKPRFGPGVAERMQIASQDQQGGSRRGATRCAPPPASISAA